MFMISLLFCRERLIHLLALRPYKKPELYARITNGKWWNWYLIWHLSTRHLIWPQPFCLFSPFLSGRIFVYTEGVREREKACIGNLLKQLSFMRDNTYHLHRHIWNDVHEDWPFYTEQDRQSLKRLASEIDIRAKKKKNAYILCYVKPHE